MKKLAESFYVLLLKGFCYKISGQCIYVDLV